MQLTPSTSKPNFAKFFETEDTREKGQDIYLDIFAGPCYPLQRLCELKQMIQIAKNIKPKTIYEIGVSRGGGFYHWCKCIPSVKRAIGCDLGGIPYTQEFEENFPDLDFLWLEDSSSHKCTIQKVNTWLNKDKIDILFIDGFKSRVPVDFDAYLPFMNPKGIIFVHDVNEGGGLVNSFKMIKSRGLHTETIIDTSESHEAAQREKDGIEATCGYEKWLRHWKGRSAGVGVVYLGEKRW